MKEILLGNEAIAWGLIHSNVDVVSGYPGTPSSEILTAYQHIKSQLKLEAYAEWSSNEKVGFEIAYAAAIANKRTCAVMKQVGLNVASDALMSAAYIGNKGGFLLVSADDPGFYSSQTEQDSRMFAKMARIPVFDPADPQEAYDLTKIAVDFSEKFETPVMLRPVLRVCHSRQLIKMKKTDFAPREGKFKRDIARWGAVPRKLRLAQGVESLARIEKIAQYNWKKFIQPKTKALKGGKILILTSGTGYVFTRETLEDVSLDIDILKFDMPYPLPVKNLRKIMSQYEKILVIEETMPIIEEQISNPNVFGKLTETVHSIDEMTNERVLAALMNIEAYTGKDIYVGKSSDENLSPRVPQLCPGCPHRDVFFAMKKVFRKRAIYPSDIGCYTLGLNQQAIDSLLCMGGSVSMSSGYSIADKTKPIIATIGDSTFLHSGIAPLLTAVYAKHKFILLILDNSVAAMTGRQPTLEDNPQVDIKQIVEGCGLKPLEYRYEPKMATTIDFMKKVKEAYDSSDYPTVAIVRGFCVLDTDAAKKNLPGKFAVVNQDNCNSCERCLQEYKCPSFFLNEGGTVEINTSLCAGCGACLSDVCPTDAFEERK